MRALYAAATGMAAQELNVQVISNNNREPADHRLQAPDRPFPGSALPEPTPGRFVDLGPEYPASRRPRHRLGRQDDLHRPDDVAGSAGIHGEGIRRRHPRRGSVPGHDARWPHRLHPRRLVRPLRTGTAGDPRRLPRRSGHHRPQQCDQRDDQRAGFDPGHGAGSDRAAESRPVPALPLRQQGRSRIHRRQPVRRNRRIRPPPSTACRAPRASATCSRATSKRRT